MGKYISFSILFSVEIVCIFLKDCSLSFLSLPGPKAVWGASSPSICCHFREMSGEISVRAPFTSISVITCSMNGQAHNTSVGVSVCIQIGSDSIIGALCQIADKTSIKRSTIGNSTTVKEKVKIANSIIMHGVTIEEGWEHTNIHTFMCFFFNLLIKLE